MSFDKNPPWHARNATRQAGPEVRRALIPGTDDVFQKPTLTQRISNKTMDSIFDRLAAFLGSWIVRYLTGAFSGWGTAYAIPDSQISAGVAGLGGLITFLFMVATRAFKAWRATRQATAAAVKILILSACLYQVQRSQADAYSLRLCASAVQPVALAA